ncbi:MAG: alpha-L-rhamnosidase N-terminal domain-containing protein [Chitinophagaceae bacterium]|jgi:hypothetical protein|nr:alpha-L-rhamnosidase N-terminal domain-containing protein [Chitinophagaceae bacterium]
MAKKNVFVALCLSAFFMYGKAQDIPVNPELLSKNWQAKWIAVTGAPENEYGVYHFRKNFELSNKPDKFIIHVSADNRYKLFVNGEMVSLGPARGDIYNWSFETVDIASQLRSGKNTIAAVVWNFAEHAPVAQMSFHKTGFIVQGDGAAEQIVNTDKTWKGVRNNSYSPATFNMRAYFVVGPGDKIDGAKYPWGWEQPKFDDSEWQTVREIITGGGKGSRDYPGWQLTPRSIPMPELTYLRIPKLRRAEGMTAPADFPKKAGNYTVPASSKVTLLLDQTYLTTAYPHLIFSKGKGAQITIKYAEAMYSNLPRREKGNRNQIEGKEFFGYGDQIIADGGDRRSFTSLWWRTYRYLQIEIQTAAEPLVLHDIYGTYTGYPFQLAAKFSAPEMPVLDTILTVGWRTARLCAQETYTDCPYYEQLQYFGDTRIQEMVSLYNTSDDRLVRNAINDGRQSIVSDGITMSRYPSNLHQYIPPFSIWWIGMIHDYWMHRSDNAFVAQQLPYVRLILNYYEQHLKADASLSYIPYWFFTDWSFSNGGEPPRTPDGQSSIQDLHFLTGLQLAAEMEQSLGMPAFADKYNEIAARIKAGFKAKYWDANRKLFADTPEKKSFSQHANIMAILTNVVEGQEAADLMTRILQEKDLTQATIYFSYYLNQALNKAGMGNQYLDRLDIWRTQLANGLTTWAESPEPSRSDCHAWGASPNIEFYRIVLGIQSAAPDFQKVLIAPNLGKLHNVSGCIPHPKGNICVSYQSDEKGKLKAEITLPEGIDGKFVWNGKETALHGGKQTLEVE